MKIVMTISIVLVLTSCTTARHPKGQELCDPDQDLQSQVTKGDEGVADSLPELKHAEEQPYTTKEFELQSADRQHFRVLVLNVFPISLPGHGFALAYLKDHHGKIVDWKSRWLGTYQGMLDFRLLDVNHDGIEEFCFVCKPFEQPDQLLSAYRVRNGRFEAVIAEDRVPFDATFQNTIVDPNIAIEPQLTGHYGWESYKMYEVPVKIINRGNAAVTLRDTQLWKVDEDAEFYCHFKALDKETLQPGEAVETTVTIMLTPQINDQKFKFKLKTFKY